MDIIETASAIKSMEIRGAGKIARAAAAALRDFVLSYTGNDVEKMKVDLIAARDTLISSRPTAVSLRNGVDFTVRGTGECSSVGDIRKKASLNADNFIRSSEKAVETIAKIGSKRIKDGSTVMTHCNSSAAVKTIIEAHRQGKSIKVFATESRPWRQGLLTVKALSDAGVDVTLIVDSAVRSIMKNVDIVMVGADTITSNGALINKIGTSQLALAANEARVPFVVCAETYKFSSQTLFGDMVTIEERDSEEVVSKKEIPAGVKIFNPVFDSTPAKYIDGIVTEIGIISPGSVYNVIIREFGDQTVRM